jgi:hypothetical protein
MMTMTLGTLVAALLTVALGASPSLAQSKPPASPPSPVGETGGTWLDRLVLFVGLDGSKQPQDLGINANIGPRFSVSWTVPVSPRLGLGVRLGAAANASDAAVNVLEQIDGTSRRFQLFSTVGLYQTKGRLSWAAGYDGLRQDYFDETWMAQLRGELEVAVGRNDQMGVRFTAPLRGANAAIGDVSLRLEPIAQVSAVARHSWPSGAATGIWVGVAEGHHNVVLVFPGNSRDTHVVVYGAELSMPLNDRWSVTGATNLMTPAATGAVDAFMGVTVRLGARRRRSPFGAMLNVANNTTFAVDLARK